MDTIQEHFKDVNFNAYDSFPCKKTSAFGVSELVLRKTVAIHQIQPPLARKYVRRCWRFYLWNERFHFWNRRVVKIGNVSNNRNVSINESEIPQCARLMWRHLWIMVQIDVPPKRCFGINFSNVWALSVTVNWQKMLIVSQTKCSMLWY